MKIGLRSNDGAKKRLRFAQQVGAVKAKMGHRVALMGNVPPLDIGVRETLADVTRWARECLAKGAPGGGMILSFGGGVSPGTPPENIDALLDAARV